MIDIRYHVYSLAAVFFALAVGVVLGTTFAKSSPPSELERRTILRYENSMRILKREIEKATEGAARYEALARASEEFCKAILPVLVKGKLEWRNVAIIQTGDYDDLTGSVKHVLELAGANVISITTLNRRFPFDNEERIDSVLAECGVLTADQAKKPLQKLYEILAGTVTVGTHSHLLEPLERLGVARFDGSYDRYRRVRLIVLVGGSSSESNNTADTVDSRLIAALNGFGATIVGCESSNVASSYVPFWQKAGIATVDNADSAIGQTALVYALNGEKANFGIKPTADRLVPQTLEGT
ncbi:MAG: copper transporter [Armatimonadetes bacterium]|nr:copper transporter [Armatimonadota bacterium]